MTLAITQAKTAARRISRLSPTLSEADLWGVCWQKAAQAEAKVDKTRPEGQQKAYIWKAAWHAGIDAYRKEIREETRRVPKTSVEDSGPAGLNIYLPSVPGGRQASQRSDPLLMSAPESSVSLASSRERCQTELRELSLLFFRVTRGCTPLERKALFLLSVEGIPQRDIATKLGCSFPAVRQLLSRGRRKCVRPENE